MIEACILNWCIYPKQSQPQSSYLRPGLQHLKEIENKNANLYTSLCAGVLGFCIYVKKVIGNKENNESEVGGMV